MTRCRTGLLLTWIIGWPLILSGCPDAGDDDVSSPALTATPPPSATPATPTAPTATPQATPTASPQPTATPTWVVTPTPVPLETPTPHTTATPASTPTAPPTTTPQPGQTPTPVPATPPASTLEPTTTPSPTATPPLDADQDGFTQPDDCDDADPDQYPGADERCNGEDDDCDTLADEDAVDAWTAYYDGDHDSYGDSSDPLLVCTLCEDCVLDGGDCDDTDPYVFPDAEELCNFVDDDCDTLVDEDFDADADGYTSCGGDCDDLSPAVHPGATEVCNGTDDDCDGDTDEEFDVDGDGYTSCGGDCDDADGTIHAGALDPCDGVDNDCDGDMDGGDQDQDGQAVACGDCDDQDSSVYTGALEVPYDGIDQDCDGADLVDVDADGYDGGDGGSDCADNDASIHPGAPEIPYDGIDQDCDGVDLLDVDADGYNGGDGGPDCADDDASIHPDAPEVPYDGVDQDCDGQDLVDVDGDGYPGGDTGEDCDDDNPGVHPNAEEVCDGVDNDCDGDIDEGLLSTWYTDADSDTFGSPDAPVDACAQPDGTVENALDCDDGDPEVYPGSDATCAGTSCQDLLDHGAAGDSGTYWIDFGGQPVLTSCDFSFEGQGWTLIFSDDFENGVDPRWSYQATYLCSEWTTILGGYGNIAHGEMSITLDLYGIAHQAARVQVQYIKLDSWDGEEAYVKVDGSPIWQANLWYYEGSEVCGWYRSGWLEGAYDDRHDIDETIDHSGNALLFVAGSTLDQSPTDESFGIDNVRIWIR